MAIKTTQIVANSWKLNIGKHGWRKRLARCASHDEETQAKSGIKGVMEFP